MPRLPGSDKDVWFGFTNALPDWRNAESAPITREVVEQVAPRRMARAAPKPPQPAVLDQMAKKFLATQDVERREAPVQTPAPEKALLVRHARRMGGTNIELPASFELAAAMPEYLPEEMRQDAWKRAAQVAAGHALERKKTRPQEAALLEQLAEGALKQAAGLRPEAPEPRPVKRWRSAR